jgi:PhnB protein
MKTPDGHQTVMPYLILKDAEQFVSFTKKVFSADEKALYRQENGRIMHGEINIGGSTIMFGESNETWDTQNAGLYVYVENADEAYKMAMEHGAESVMEPDTKDYGRTCGIKDPCGNTWWMTTALN